MCTDILSLNWKFQIAITITFIQCYARIDVPRLSNRLITLNLDSETIWHAVGEQAQVKMILPFDLVGDYVIFFIVFGELERTVVHNVRYLSGVFVEH